MLEAARIIADKADMSNIRGKTDLQILAWQMGTSIGMLE
jgi:hypothetical protein